jgi:hypothetical protein
MPTSQNNIASEFMNKVKTGDYASAKSMLWDPKTPYGDLLDGNLEKLHVLLIKYPIPDFRKWNTEYDTANLVKTKTFIIPIYKGFDQSNRLKEASVEIDFEYGGQHIGNKIMSFGVHTLYDR